LTEKEAKTASRVNADEMNSKMKIATTIAQRNLDFKQEITEDGSDSGSDSDAVKNEYYKDMKKRKAPLAATAAASKDPGNTAALQLSTPGRKSAIRCDSCKRQQRLYQSRKFNGNMKTKPKKN
jgi:hypothetical protein